MCIKECDEVKRESRKRRRKRKERREEKRKRKRGEREGKVKEGWKRKRGKEWWVVWNAERAGAG